MGKIKLNLSRLSITAKLEFAKQIVQAMTGNTNFPTPNPTLTQVTTAISELDTARAEVLALRNEAKTKTLVQNQLEDVLDTLLTRLASYVENTSDDPAVITSTGMNLKGAATPVGELEMPSSFTTTVGDSEGELDVSYNAVFGAHSYNLQISLQAPPAAVWTHAKSTTKSKETLTGLVSGQRYWVRVAAVGPKGQSPWSEASTRIAP
jgi:hypothetical protein